ncbi:hypothetical protein V9T40_009706 [Parthenolecanium corni]|uniref:ATP-dependent DNA helicase 2 subunit 1 n=1 Tax=Parthenolecanium corni TaxID=536013 RepID=A0AAN9TNA9_9HEMI
MDDGLNFDVEETEQQSNEIWNTREITVFLLDSTSKMFEKRSDDTIFFQLCLRCCKSVFMNKIIGSSSDLLSIVFFGTKEHDPGDQNPKNIVTFFEPQQPNASVIKDLNKMINSDTCDDFSTKYGHSDDYSLADLFWHVSSLISKSPVKVAVRKIILFTCNDNPLHNDTMKSYQARKKAEDIHNLQIELDVIPLGEHFNGDLFFNEIMQIVNGPNSTVPKGTSKIEELLEQTFRRDSKKRSIANLTLNIGNDIRINVNMFNFYRPLRIPSIMKLDNKMNEQVKNTAQTYNSETGERLLKTDVIKYYETGDKQIMFTVQELERFHMNVAKGIELLGFKSLSELSPENYFKPSSFIFPSEDKIKGSSLLFTTLLRRCLEKQKFMLCYIVSRVKSKPWLAALVPQEEENNMPAGFHILYLPYADYIREIPYPPQSELTPEKVDLFKKILKKISFQYSPSVFENPDIQKHWANIEALALNYTEPRSITDETLRDYSQISERLGGLEDEFVDTFFPTTYNPEFEFEKKRTFSDYSASNKWKLAKFDPEDPDYVEKVARGGQADKLTVPILKEYLLKHNINVKGKKQDLLDRLFESLGIKSS